jgi:receptor protein-tyrosine kinase
MSTTQPTISTQDSGRPEVIHSVPTIGALLIEAGKLTSDKLGMIRGRQEQDDSLFGEAAVKLGLVSQHDVNAAISRQFALNRLTAGDSNVSDEVFVAYWPEAREAESLRRLRNTLLLGQLRDAMSRNVLSIVSAHSGEGRSVLVANLAVMFAQIGRRTLLIDADLHNSRQHELFGLAGRKGLSNILAGMNSSEVIEQITGLGELYVLQAGVAPPNPQELIGRQVFRRLLENLKHQFDVILLDTPPMEKYGDAQIIAAAADVTIFVVRNNVGRVAVIKKMVDSLVQADVNLAGCFFNNF